MQKLIWLAALAVLGCGDVASSSDDECRPLDMKCDGTMQLHCAPDVDLIQQGQHVYVWQDYVDCADDLEEILGAAICVEAHHENGLTSADCARTPSKGDATH